MTLLWLSNSGHYYTKPRAQTITIVSWGAYYKRQEVPVSLSRKQVFSALAREVPRAGKLVANPARTWQDLDPALPARPINHGAGYEDYWVLRPDENGWL